MRLEEGEKIAELLFDGTKNSGSLNAKLESVPYIKSILYKTNF